MASATLTAAPESAAIPPESVYQLSVEQYHQMAEAGILTEADENSCQISLRNYALRAV